MELYHFNESFDKKDEFNKIFELFKKKLGNIESDKNIILAEKKNDIQNREELLMYLPYWITEICNTPFSITKTRKLILSCLLGSVHFTIQDKIIDGDDTEVENNYSLGFQSNLFFLDGILLIKQVLENKHKLDDYLNKYFVEFVNSHIREKENHLNKIQDYKLPDLKSLGRKFAPVKLCVTATFLLSNSEDKISIFEEVIDSYYTGYQLIDDLKDWKQDLKAGNYTFFLTKLAKYSDLKNTIDPNLFQKAFKETILIAIENFEKAYFMTLEVNARRFANHIGHMIKNCYYFAEQNNVYCWSNKKLYKSRYCIEISKNGNSYILNLKTNGLYQLDKLAKKILDQYSLPCEKVKPSNTKEYDLVENLIKNNILSYIDYSTYSYNTDKLLTEPVMRLELSIGSNLNIDKYLNILFSNTTKNKKEIIFIVNSSTWSSINNNILTEIRRKSSLVKQDIDINILVEEIESTLLSQLFSLNFNQYSIIVRDNNELKSFYNETLKHNVYSKTKFINHSNFIPQNNNDTQLLSSFCNFNLQNISRLKNVSESINKKYNDELSRRLKVFKFNCNAGKTSFFISGSSGNIYPCYWYYKKHNNPNNATNKIHEVIEQFKFSLLKLDNRCQKCNIVEVCKGGCPYEPKENSYCSSLKIDYYNQVIS